MGTSSLGQEGVRKGGRPPHAARPAAAIESLNPVPLAIVTP